MTDTPLSGLPEGMREELAAKPLESPRKADLPAPDSDSAKDQDAALGRYLALQLERDERWPDINAIPPAENAEEEAICDRMSDCWYRMGDENIRRSAALIIATRQHFEKRAHPKRDPLGDGISEVQLIDFMGNDLSIVRAARVSTARDGVEEGAEKLLNYLAKHRHDSPFEMGTLQFRIKAPLFVIAQWHRHRIGWSYNQESRRYTSENIQFYVPTVWRKQAKTNKQASAGEFADDKNYWFAEKLSDICEDAENEYKFILEQDGAREQARMILPQNLYASMYVTCNLRSLFHFWGLRAAPEAQWEIRVYAEVMGEIAAKLFPLAWKALLDAHQAAQRLRQENESLKARVAELERLLTPSAEGVATQFVGAPEMKREGDLA